MKTIYKSAFGLLIGASLIACGGAEKKAEETPATETAQESKAEPVEKSINVNESKIMWEGNMLGMYSHSGTIQLTEGKLTMEGDKITAGDFTVDLTSMVPTDENYDVEKGHTKDKLVAHLSSNDFFLVDSFPTANFTIISHNPAENTLTGTLTVRGISHEETVEDVAINEAEGSAKGKLVFDRTKYDVSFSHPAEEMVLSDDITLDIELKM
jgi:polyisoprenoid-binding protein YceI